jgi:hypothetical protein
MKNRWMLVWMVTIILVLSAFVAQARADEESPVYAQKELPAEESPVSVSVEVIGSKDTGVWLYAERKVTEKLAFSISAAKYQKGFQEVVFGPAYYLTPEIQVGIGLGAAQYVSSDKSRLVISAVGYMETDHLKAEVLFEKYGRDPKPYYRVYAETPFMPISEKLMIGVHGEQYVGWGPRISWSFGKNVNIWLSPLVERQGGNALVGGIKFTF